MIPLLDWRVADRDPAGFARELGRACRETGFFLLQHHPIAPGLIRQMFDEADSFFALPEAEKARLSIAHNPHNRGWVYMGSERLDDSSGQVDRKEAFNIGLDLAANDPRVIEGAPFRGVNVWPPLPRFREVALTYFDLLWGLGCEVQRLIAMDLGLPPGFFGPCFTAPMATLRLLRYPAASGAEAEIGAGAHTDYGALTLLMTDGEAGLQVQPRGGDWMDVPHVPGAFVVNIGDCLMRWTNGLYVSTPHRVLPPARPRRSIAFFLDPNPDVVIEALPGTGAPQWPPVTASAYLRSRLEATYTPPVSDLTKSE